MRYNDVLIGTEVFLRLLSEEDVALLARWFSDPEVVHWLQRKEYS
jgi:hypothetical protein